MVAVANTGYVFSNWTENGTQVSTSANYSFTVMGNRTLVANFVAATYTVSVTLNPSNGGTVTGAGVFNNGQTCSLVATPNANYKFISWVENSVIIDTNTTYSFAVYSDQSITANFSSTIGIDISNNQQLSMQIYPNPNKGIFIIEINSTTNKSDNYQLEVYSALGKLIHREKISGGANIRKQMHFKALSKGVYFVRLRSKNDVLTTRFIIE